MNIFAKFFALLQFREAVKKANIAYETNNHRYYVMPTADYSGKLVVLDRNNFRILKRKGYINQDASVRNLIDECFYYTPNTGGCDALPEYGLQVKTESFLNWKKAVRQQKKRIKKNKKTKV